jgi:hypothetical protein
MHLCSQHASDMRLLMMELWQEWWYDCDGNASHFTSYKLFLHGLLLSCVRSCLCLAVWNCNRCCASFLWRIHILRLHSVLIISVCSGRHKWSIIPSPFAMRVQNFQWRNEFAAHLLIIEVLWFASQLSMRSWWVYRGNENDHHPIALENCRTDSCSVNVDWNNVLLCIY